MKILTTISAVVLSLFLVTSCQDYDNDVEDKKGAVVFKGNLTEKGGSELKLTNNQTVEYAKVTINGVEYLPKVIYVNGNMITETIKLEPGSYSLSQFDLYDDMGTPNDVGDDELLLSIPQAGSDYAKYVASPLDFTFVIEAFYKEEIDVEVLRFEEAEWEEFGFQWFNIDESRIRQQCFFGDICIKNPDEYVGSKYEEQTGGLKHDMPAIIELEVWQKSEYKGDTDYHLVDTFSSESYAGEGKPLCIDYQDYIGYLDEYKVKLSILVKSGSSFVFKHFYTWQFTDDNKIPEPNSSDGIVDFVLGSCVQGADYDIAPYMNLPSTAKYKVLAYGNNNTTGAYLDAQLSDIGTGYDISNGTWPSWCFDYQKTINVGPTYNMDVYSSLYVSQLPTFAQGFEWDRANWLMNNLDGYSGYQWKDVQAALWLIEGWPGTSSHGGVPAAGPIAQQMANDANTYGDGYVPPLGGWAAVVFIKQGTPDDAPVLQTVFVMVDP